ncbi:hypothetical protein UlMin_006088 [Ulmus minor]
MSCFILPDSIVKEIEAACARFWWGSTPEHRRVHWKKWQNLCSPKAMGGMGFKNLSVFNQALLGKQVWRFLQRPNSLVARVFKAKYFPYSSIWEASTSSTSSYIWKSLLWGRNLVAKGVRWQVGNGKSISVYNSRWVPIPWDFKLASPRVLQHDAMVSCLLQEDDNWNKQLITSAFLYFEAEAILTLPRPSIHHHNHDSIDTYCWHMDNKGLYTVQSAYVRPEKISVSNFPLL